MTRTLSQTLQILQAHQGDLHKLGVRHAAVFGSVARGQAGAGSDVDVLVDLDPQRPLDLFEYARVKLYIGELIEGADVVNRRTLRPLLRDAILRDAVNAF